MLGDTEPLIVARSDWLPPRACASATQYQQKIDMSLLWTRFLLVIMLVIASHAQPGPPFGPEKAYLVCTDVADDCSEQSARCESLEHGAYMQAMCPKTCKSCLPDGCLGVTWPNVTNCVRWSHDSK